MKLIIIRLIVRMKKQKQKKIKKIKGFVSLKMKLMIIIMM